MKKSFLLLIITLSVLLLSGCDIEYKMDIDKDLKVMEYLNFEEKDINISMDETSLESLIKEKQDYYTPTIGNYSSNIIQKNNLTKVENFRQYEKLSNFIRTESSIIGRFLKNRHYAVKGKIATITGTLSFPSIASEDINIDNAYFTISLPFVVTGHNADEVSGTNLLKQYKWKIERFETNKEVNLSFKTNALLTEKKKKVELNIGYIIIIIIVVAFAIFLLFFMDKFRKSNKI